MAEPTASACCCDYDPPSLRCNQCLHGRHASCLDRLIVVHGDQTERERHNGRSDHA
jgi:hypothetical protein